MTAEDPWDLDVAEVEVAAAEGVAEGGPSSDGEHNAAVTDRLGDLASAVSRLAAETERFHSRAEHLERLNRSMHEEIETLRRGEAQELLKPVINQLADLAIRLRRQSEQLDAAMSADEAATMLAAYVPVVLDILGQLGVESYLPEVGEAFDRNTQRAVRRIDVPDAEQDRTVVRVQSPGFIATGAQRPLRPAEVDVARFVEGTITQPLTSSPTDQQGDRA